MIQYAMLGLLLLGTVAGAQVCPPAGCTLTCSQDLLVYECTGSTQPHFVLGDGTLLTEVSGVTAGFSVAGATVTTTIGNAAIPPFTIGSSESRVRWTTPSGGQCVQVRNLNGFVNPTPVVVENRALTMSSRNPIYCREPGRDLICFAVKGQVTGPFPPLACTVDRVELACGTVS